MNVVIVSQLGMVYDVYTENAFIKEVQNCVPTYKIKDIEEAINIYVDEVYSDDCLTVDVMEVQE